MTPVHKFSERYQLFIDGVLFVCTVMRVSPKFAAKIFAEITLKPNPLEIQLTNYKKYVEFSDPAEHIYPPLDFFINGYLGNRVNGEPMPEWMAHAGLSKQIE